MIRTNGERYGPAMEITDPVEADRYFAALVNEQMQCSATPIDRASAEAIERSNLGYYAGYYSDGTRQRVERLFRCAHPIFGRIQGVK